MDKTNNKISIRALEDTILEGILNAQEVYLQWSSKETLHTAPEYFLTVQIAQEIAKLKQNKFITLEDSVRDTLEVAKTEDVDFESDDIRSNGRFDIVLWWASGYPRAIIEVKRRVYKFAKIEQDVKRICEVLKKSPQTSTIQNGYIAFCLKHGNNDEMIEKFYKQAKDLVQSYGHKVSWKKVALSENDENIYTAVVFTIKRKNQRD